MSALYRNGFSGPIVPTTAFEFGWTGQSSTTRFHGLSGGNTSRADRMAAASGSSNETGFVMAGILAALMRATRAGSLATVPFAAGADEPPPAGIGVTVRS